jgi:hypothetical protein
VNSRGEKGLYIRLKDTGFHAILIAALKLRNPHVQLLYDLLRIKNITVTVEVKIYITLQYN